MDKSWFDDGWSCDEWNGDRNSVGWHESCEQTYDNFANSISLGGSDLGARSSPKRFEWVKMNLVSGAAVNTGPLNFGPDGAGDGRFFCTASGECILDVEHGSFQGYDENDLCRSLNGRLTGVQKNLSTSSTISLSTQVKSTEQNTLNNSQQPGNELAGPRPRESNENTRIWIQLVMTLNQLKRHWKMSRWRTMMMKNL